eukprot:CAMPEP_0172376858 /NCGR_PEP_ID=MMETSP1060-20121228/68606_1 /TAXON_ID=37318 /ORGANISM="Pseudo-nitzschia pungens, Strain cf. cingulata" /LENGTH=355 /DNA_ID=CAMNT_0013104523 /DNA_START=189 /DNA_END=1256 /DNA_ORIENTATION=+
MARPRQQRTNTSLAMPLLVAASMFLGRATAQPPAPDICACSPSKYSFLFDFSLTCPPVNVERNGAISATFCQISPFGDENQNITDLVPIEVQYVDVLELGQRFEVLSQQNITGTFVDGDVFEYASIVEDDDNIDIPKVIQLNIFARNAAGQPIVNFFAIAYSNICDEYPTLVDGQSAGWTEFVNLEPPSPEFCVVPPTEAPVVPPTEAPVVPPTEAPVVPPTIAPIAMSMDLSMSMDMGTSELMRSMMEWKDIQYKMLDLDDMSMSMPLAAMKLETEDEDIRMFLRANMEKTGKVVKAMKGSTKSYKSSKSEATTDKSLKISKVSKASFDGLKSEKAIKSEKATRRRRLRVHRVD